MYVRSGDKLWYINKLSQGFQLISDNPAVLVEFDRIISSASQSLTNEQLVKIAYLTKHIHDESMVQMLHRYLKKLSDGEREIATQTLGQFPEGWKIIESERNKLDCVALKTFAERLKVCTTNNEYEAAVQEFRDYLKKAYIDKGIITKGKHFNTNLLIESLRVIEKLDEFFKKNDFDHKNSIRNIIFGTIQCYAPANMAQAFCQGLFPLIVGGEKLKRDLKICNTNHYYFPLYSNPDFRMGYEYSVSPSTGLFNNAWRISELYALDNIKNCAILSLCAEARQYQEKQTSIIKRSLNSNTPNLNGPV